MTVRSVSKVLIVCALAGTSCGRVDIYAVTKERVLDAGASSGQPTTTTAAVTTTTAAATTTATTAVTSTRETTTSATATVDDGGAPMERCPMPAALPGDTSVTIAVGSLTRSYVLHVPTTYVWNEPAPLIIDFHGAGGSGLDQLETSPYPEVTDSEGVVVVFPDGVNGPIGNAWNIGPCCVPGVDDLAFVDALLEDIKQRICVDVKRVYAVGVLTGGGLVHHLACERAEAFAGVAPAAFDLVEETVDMCVPAAPISVIAFRDTEDPKVPYNGGSSSLVPDMPVTFLGAEGSFNRWASLNGCTGEPSPPDERGCSSYTECNDGVEVVLCTEREGRSGQGDATVAWPRLKRHVR